ncbi:hypothetical protein [Massilia eburnea]|uniref:hypothetical protein n=1 Tax=Massilia eburnea TaxID=1776165 RepID=UPI003D6C1869
MQLALPDAQAQGRFRLRLRQGVRRVEQVREQGGGVVAAPGLPQLARRQPLPRCRTGLGRLQRRFRRLLGRQLA